VSIAHQSAMATPAIQARPRRPLRAYPAPRPVFALVRIGGLIGLAAIGAIALAGLAGMGLLLVLVRVG
jgi:hypothetical protein